MKEMPPDEYVHLLLTDGFNEPCEINPDDKFELPEWYDEDKYKRGQKFIKDNLFAQFTCTLTGVIFNAGVPSILDILSKTSKSSTVMTAYRRYVSTIFHIMSWYTDDLRPGTRSWKSLMEVRNRHFQGSKISQMKKDKFISQADMVLTQYGFFATGLITPDKVGMTAERDGVEGYVHFWRTIAYMLGVQDRFNLGCDSVDDCKKACEIIRRQVYCRNLQSPPEYFIQMVSAILQAMSVYNPLLTEGSYMYYTFWLIGVDGYKYSKDTETFSIKYTFDESKAEKKLSKLNTFNLRVIMAINMKILTTQLGRWCLNTMTLLIVFFLHYLPIMAIFRFGLRNAYVNMFEKDIAEKTVMLKNREAFEKLQY